MPMNDPSNIRESDARSLELVVSVEALKHTKQFVHVLHIEPRAIVPDEDLGFTRGRLGGADLNLCSGAMSSKLQGVREQVREHLTQHRRIAVDLGQ